LFNIKKYYIFRRKPEDEQYTFLQEVHSNVFQYEDSGFTSKAEQNQYIYAVSCADANNKESLKTETSQNSSPIANKITHQKETPDINKH
jgi:hypothetical protein